MVRRHHLERALKLRPVATELPPHHGDKVRRRVARAVEGVRARVNRHEAAPRLNPIQQFLHPRLTHGLPLVLAAHLRDVALRVEHDHVVAFEVLRVDRGRVLRGGHLPVLLFGDRLENLGRVTRLSVRLRHRTVLKPFRFRDVQNAQWLIRSRR